MFYLLAYLTFSAFSLSVIYYAINHTAISSINDGEVYEDLLKSIPNDIPKIAEPYNVDPEEYLNRFYAEATENKPDARLSN